MSKAKEKLWGFLLVVILIAIFILLVLGVKGLDNLSRAMYPYPKETNFEEMFEDVTKVVFLNNEMTSDGNYTGAYFDSDSDISTIKDIITSTVNTKKVTKNYLKQHKLNKIVKWVYIFHSDGTKDVIKFYGSGSHYYELENGEMGYLKFEDKTLTRFVDDNQYYGCVMDKDFNVIKYGQGLDYHVFFGKDKYAPWWGY